MNFTSRNIKHLMSFRRSVIHQKGTLLTEKHDLRNYLINKALESIKRVWLFQDK